VTPRYLLAILACLATVHAAAQVPGLPAGILPGTAPPKAAAPAAEAPAAKQAAASAESPEAVRARIERQLSEARAAREAVVPPPEGIGPAEIARQRDALDVIVYGTEGQLRTLALLQKARAQLDAARAAERAWQGFAEPPPYSVRKVDALRDAAIETSDARCPAGTARGVDGQGGLRVETADGLRTIHGGEVSVRPLGQALPAAGVLSP